MADLIGCLDELERDLDTVLSKRERNGRLAERVRCATLVCEAADLYPTSDLRYRFGLELARRIIESEEGEEDR